MVKKLIKKRRATSYIAKKIREGKIWPDDIVYCYCNSQKEEEIADNVHIICGGIVK